MTSYSPQPLQRPPGYRDPNAPPMPPPGAGGPRKLPPTFYQEKKRRSCCCRCCCCICCLLFFLIFLIGVLAAVLFIWFEPQAPQFSFQSFNITQFDIVDNTLNAQTEITVQAKNPNRKMAVVYGRTSVNLEMEGDDIGSASVPGFKQKPESKTPVKIETTGKKKLENGEAEKLLQKYEQKTLKVDAAVRTSVGLDMQGLTIGPVKVDVNCGGVSISKIDKESPKCKMIIMDMIQV